MATSKAKAADAAKPAHSKAWLRDQARDEAREHRAELEGCALAEAVHVPPPDIKSQLGLISFEAADICPGGRLKELYLAYLPTPAGFGSKQVLYYETSSLDLDTDGATGSWKGASAESTHDYVTSLDKHLGVTGKGASMHAKDGKTTDANVIPYFVLPLAAAHNDSDWVGRDRGIGLGDLGVIVGMNRVVCAQFADCGPFYKIGEASIEAHREFGKSYDRLKAGHLTDAGIDHPFATIVFPGSAPASGRLTPNEIQERALALFARLGGLPGSLGMGDLTGATGGRA
jgi:hypothetical protein